MSTEFGPSRDMKALSAVITHKEYFSFFVKKEKQIKNQKFKI